MTNHMENPIRIKEAAIEFIDSLLPGIYGTNYELFDDLVELMDMVEQDEITPCNAVTRATFLFRMKNS